MGNDVSLKKKLNELWLKIVGDAKIFSLRARIFHSVCFIVLLALLYNIPFNYAIDLPGIALESFFLLLVTSLLYYNSRIRRKISVSINLALLVSYGFFAVNYFLNSGIHGPTDLFFLLMLIFSIAIARVNQYKIWISLNFLLAMGLHFLQYLYPQWFPDTYTSRLYAFVDISSGYLVVSVMTLYCMTYIRRHYEAEKNSAEAKSRSIEEQNRQILKQNLELQRLNSEKNKLMSIIAHDLRSPLGSIQNSLEIITEYDLEIEDKQFIERELLLKTKKTSAMLTKLLSWSKSQMTGISVFPGRYNLADLLKNTLENETSIAAQKRIYVDSVIDPSIEIYADADMMELIIRNLVGNAIKFTENGGSVSISTAKKDKDCWICIRDTGTGIPLEKQKEIFSLTAKSTFGTENEKGVGLGLLLCKEFITAQAGRIWYESQPGSGTAFYVAIPLFNEQSQDLAPVLDSSAVTSCTPATAISQD
jgi:two-component system sensor histidine kinase/response regulator